MKKVIIIGATSGIGKELARIFSRNGYTVGIAGRRINLLEELKKELSGDVHSQYIDITDTDTAISSLEKLISDMNGTDMIIISSGTGHENPELEWSLEEDTIKTNVAGFTAMAGAAFRYFVKKGSGHLAAISSVAGIRGAGDGPAYNASKAFVSNYLEGLRHRSVKMKIPVTVTDIIPGFVDTAMAKGEGLFWVAPCEKAAIQIYMALEQKKNKVYITKRWALVGALLRIMPDFIYYKF
ncbi:MAG: SDR family NAD(P)-dependent oxidoreductase [Candidatus Eremiobacterota bacterium]